MPLLCIGESAAAMQSLARESMHPPQVKKLPSCQCLWTTVSLRSPADHLQQVKMEQLINWFTCLKWRMGRKLWNKPREGGLSTMTFGGVSVNCCVTLCTRTLPSRTYWVTIGSNNNIWHAMRGRTQSVTRPSLDINLVGSLVMKANALSEASLKWFGGSVKGPTPDGSF